MILEKVVNLCNSNGISISALERELGFGNATIRMWASCDPGVSKLKKVADYFGVSVDFLLTPDDTTATGR